MVARDRQMANLARLLGALEGLEERFGENIARRLHLGVAVDIEKVGTQPSEAGVDVSGD